MMPSPLVSTSGVVPPSLNNWKVVPAGKLLDAPKVMLKVSMPVPLLVTTLVKLIVEPGLAGPGSVSPVKVTAAVCVTVKGTVLDVPVLVPLPLLYDVVAVLLMTPGALATSTLTWKDKVPD